MVFFKKNHQRSLTLIELLVVIAIISLLAATTVVVLHKARAAGRDAKRIAELNTLSKALELYYANDDKYPSDSDVSGCVEEGNVHNILNSALVEKGYLGSLPRDPKYDSSSCFSGTEPFGENCFCFFYETREEGQFYRITAKLEGGGTLSLEDGGTEADMYEVMSKMGPPLPYSLPPLYSNWTKIDTTKPGIQWFRAGGVFSPGIYKIRATEWYTYWSISPGDIDLCRSISLSSPANEYVCADAKPSLDEATESGATKYGQCKIYAWCPGEHGCTGKTQFTVKTWTDNTYDNDYLGGALPHGPYLVIETLPPTITEYFTVNKNNFYFIKLKRIMSAEDYNQLIATGEFETKADSKIGYHFSDCYYGDNAQQMHSNVALKKIK